MGAHRSAAHCSARFSSDTFSNSPRLATSSSRRLRMYSVWSCHSPAAAVASSSSALSRLDCSSAAASASLTLARSVCAPTRASISAARRSVVSRICSSSSATLACAAASAPRSDAASSYTQRRRPCTSAGHPHSSYAAKWPQGPRCGTAWETAHLRGHQLIVVHGLRVCACLHQLAVHLHFLVARARLAVAPVLRLLAPLCELRRRCRRLTLIALAHPRLRLLHAGAPCYQRDSLAARGPRLDGELVEPAQLNMQLQKRLSAESARRSAPR